MNTSTQDKAIEGLIAFWEDIYFVQGKEYVAARLKSGIENALQEISPLFFSLAEGFAKYKNYPIETRRDLLRKDLEQKPNQLIVEFLKRWLYYTARGCNEAGRTEAEMAQLYINYVKDVLSSITLKDLLYEGLRLSTSSVAGADKRLEVILDKRFKDSYEQDLKITLWDLVYPSLQSLAGGLFSPEVKENRHANRAWDKFIEGMPPKTPEEQVALLLRIYKNREPKLNRTIQLSVIRGMIADLPDIHEEVKLLNTHNIEQPMPENANELELELLWKQPVELTEEEGREAIKEALASKGIGYDELTPKEWAEIFERYALIRKGYEFSSKTGVSIGSYYGKNTDKKKKRWSRVKQKIEKKQPAS
jgi:hypothetical protein